MNPNNTDYQSHLKSLLELYDSLLSEHHFSGLVIPSGVPKTVFLDDNSYPFKVNTHFKALLPVTQVPHSYIIYQVALKPILVFYQPEDYWHVVPSDPEGVWVDFFDIKIVRGTDDWKQFVPKDCDKLVWIGEEQPGRIEVGINTINPDELLNPIHYRRAVKSEYEKSCLRVASLMAARGHMAAKKAFYAGGSELETHLAYLKASKQQEQYLPYGNIVALNEHGAVLHYTELQSQRFSESDRHSFLLDAGADYHGYYSDITRTWAYRDDEFKDLIVTFENLQLEILDELKVGGSYVDLHINCHYKLADLLKETGFISCDASTAVESGITSTFYPHGLGHLLGLQVHDAGGHQTTATGEITNPPAAHPFLRLTRNLESGYCFTIEPGLYFIDMLLEKLKSTAHSNHVNWSMIERFKKYGGIRVEDDVILSDEGVENLTRDAFALLQ